MQKSKKNQCLQNRASKLVLSLLEHKKVEDFLFLPCNLLASEISQTDTYNYLYSVLLNNTNVYLKILVHVISVFFSSFKFKNM